MTSQELEETELNVVRYFERQAQVVQFYAQGLREIDIQKQMGLSIKEIKQHLAEFREYAKQDVVIRERSKEVVLIVDQHYSDIVKKLHENIDEANLAGDYKAAMAGLKMVADAEAKRVELLAKAGILADNGLGDQIIEQEHKQQVLIDILKEISQKYPNVGLEIQQRLSEVTGKVEGIKRA